MSRKPGCQKRAAYTGLRRDVISLISGAPKAVLDVGCSNGVLLQYLRERFAITYGVGIEFDDYMAQEAAEIADKLIRADLDVFDWSQLHSERYDLMVFADVLEHTKDPARVLNNAVKSATKDTEIIISLPNIQHWTAIKNLIMGDWPQRERGLFDRTHLRFFTLKSMHNLLENCGLELQSIHRNYRLLDSPRSKFNRFSKILAFPPFRPFLTYQYVLKAKLV